MNRWGSRWCSTVLVAILPFPFARADSPRWIERGFDFAKDPRLPALTRAATEFARQGLASVELRLGLKPGKLPLIWVLDLSRPEIASRPGEPFEAARTRIREEGVEVLLPARKYLASPETSGAPILHEAVHAVMASIAGSNEIYERMPRWFREGFALLLSDEGDALFKDTLAYTVFQGAPATSFLKGLLSPDATYAEAYLAALELEERLGQEGLRVLGARASEGASLDRWLEAVLGTSQKAFEARVLARSKEWIRTLLPEEKEQAMRKALEARARGDVVGSQKAFVSLLESSSTPALDSTLRYLVVQSRLGSPRPGASTDPSREIESGRMLEALLSSRSQLWRPRALILLGDWRLRMGDREKARGAWLQVLEVFGEDAAIADEARRKLETNR